MINQIFADTPELRDVLHPPPDEAHEISRVVRLFNHFFDTNCIPKYEKNITHVRFLNDAIATVLKEFFGAGYDAPYFMVWDHWSYCFVIQMADFARYFEDLFFPGEDDLMLAAVDGSYYIYISHEEIIHIYDGAQIREGANPDLGLK